MLDDSFWSRLRKGRLFQVLLVYLGVSWVVLQVVGELHELLSLPDWIGPVALILLAVGLIAILATAWVQSHPLVDAREATDEVPGSWELDVGDALRSVREGHLPHLTWGRAIGAGVGAFVLLFAVAGMYVRFSGRVSLGPKEASAEAAPDGIAVLPFAVRGQDVADWREGMVDLLSTDLDGAGGLRAIDSRTVLARWHQVVPDSADVDERTALEVARRLGARYAMMGTAVAMGPRVRVTVQLHELVPNGSRRIGQVQVQGAPDSVFTLVDSLSFATLGLLVEGDNGEIPHVDLASVTTSSLPALKAYLEGEAHFRRGEFEAAADAYSQAVADDSLFALAWYRLSESYGWQEGAGKERGSDASRRAAQLVDRLPDRVAMLARGQLATERFDTSAIGILQRAVQKYPDDAEAWYSLGDAYLHVRMGLHGWDDAIEAMQRAVDLAPNFGPYRIHLVDDALRNRADSALARKRLDDFERLAPGSPQAGYYRAAFALDFGDSTHRADMLRQITDSLSQSDLGRTDFGRYVSQALTHPRFFERAFEPFAKLGLKYVPASDQPNVRVGYADQLILARGRVREGLRVLRDPTVPAPRQMFPLLKWELAGVPGLRAALDSVLERVPGNNGQFFRAIRAAEDGDLGPSRDVVAGIRADADSLRAAGDTVGARRGMATLHLFQGITLWKAGKVEDGIREMEAGYGMANADPATFWLGLAHLQAGEPRKAIPFLKAQMTWIPQPLAAYYLAQAYEQTGQDDDARTMLAFFVENWSGADPALQPMVKDARERLARLSPDRRQ